MNGQKPWYEKLGVWVGIFAGIFTITGISLKGLLSNHDAAPTINPPSESSPVETSVKTSNEDISVKSTDPDSNDTTPNSSSISQESSNDSKIQISETHTPEDLVYVYYPNWDVDNDYGIDGNRYGGGIKVTISHMFSSLGDNSGRDISSKIKIPLSDELKESSPIEEHIFDGAFVLHESMYGSKSTATIKIIVDNEILFTTDFSSETTEAVKFSINYGNADSIFIETDATLRGSDFVFGIVVPKE